MMDEHDKNSDITATEILERNLELAPEGELKDKARKELMDHKRSFVIVKLKALREWLESHDFVDMANVRGFYSDEQYRKQSIIRVAVDTKKAESIDFSVSDIEENIFKYPSIVDTLLDDVRASFNRRFKDQLEDSNA